MQYKLTAPQTAAPFLTKIENSNLHDRGFSAGLLYETALKCTSFSLVYLINWQLNVCEKEIDVLGLVTETWYWI